MISLKPKAGWGEEVNRDNKSIESSFGDQEEAQNQDKSSSFGQMVGEEVGKKLLHVYKTIVAAVTRAWPGDAPGLGLWKQIYTLTDIWA